MGVSQGVCDAERRAAGERREPCERLGKAKAFATQSVAPQADDASHASGWEMPRQSQREI